MPARFRAHAVQSSHHEPLWLCADARHSARIMALVLHPYIMGAPHRLKYVRSALAHIRQHPGIVFWTGEQILDWYLAQRR